MGFVKEVDLHQFVQHTQAMQVTQIPVFTVADRLRKARQFAGIKSHAKMADELGIHSDTVKRYENGTSTPTRAIIIAWAAITGVDARWIATGEFVEEEEDAATSRVTLWQSRAAWSYDLNTATNNAVDLELCPA